MQNILLQEAIRVLMHSKNNAEGFSDSEYEDHMKTLSQQ
jgi:hypothetical protein